MHPATSKTVFLNQLTKPKPDTLFLSLPIYRVFKSRFDAGSRSEKQAGNTLSPVKPTFMPRNMQKCFTGHNAV